MRPRTRHLRVLGYARVSSLEQALGTSLSDQQNVIRAYAKARGFEVAKMFVEAETAIHESAESRFQMNALMAEVRPGDLVLVDKLDRWSRDPENTYRTVRVIRDREASFYAIGDNCDPSTYEGDTMLNVRVLVAKEEHKRLKQRMVGTRILLRDRGYYCEGLPPWGYRRQEIRGADRNVLLVNEDEAKTIRRAFRLCIEGRSISEIATTLDVHRDRVADALHRRFYLGEIENSHGEWIRGKHAPILDARTFQAAIDALAGRRYGSRSPTVGVQTASWWLRDVARCGACGVGMAAAYGQKKGTGNPRNYYFTCRRRCTRRFVNVFRAEEQADPMVVERLKELRTQLAQPPPAAPSAPRVVDIDQQRARLAAKRERYLEAFADGHTTREELAAKLAKLDTERTRLDASVVVVLPAPKENRVAMLRELRAVSAAWHRAPGEERRQIVNGLAKTAALSPETAPRFSWFTDDDLARRKG